MRKPRIPQMLVNIVQTALTAYDGTVFDNREACLLCGGELLKGIIKRKTVHNYP